MRRLVLIALLAAACSSGGGAVANIPKPKLQIVPRTNLAEVVPTVATVIAVHYEVRVTNMAAVPVTLKRIDLDAMPGGGFAIEAKTRLYDVTIAPGTTESVDFVTSASIQDPTGFAATMPVAIRAQALFDSPEGKLQSAVQQRVTMQSGH